MFTRFLLIYGSLFFFTSFVFAGNVDQPLKKPAPEVQTNTKNTDQHPIENEKIVVKNENLDCGDEENYEICKEQYKEKFKLPLQVISLGLAFSNIPSTESGYALPGTTRTYDTALATSWSNIEEYKNFDWYRENNSLTTKTFTGSNHVNPFDQLGVNDALAYGLTGRGIKVNITDAGLCGDHVDLNGKTITTYGTVSNSTSGNNHGCHVSTTISGLYNNNSASTNPFYTDDRKYSMMGIAHNADLNFVSFSGAGTNCSTDSSTDCWGPQHWELALEDMIAKDIKVTSNSWTWDDSADVDHILNYASTNSVSVYEALVHYQTNDANGNGVVDVWSPSSTTVQQWQEFIEAVDEFQKTGVYVTSNSNTTSMSTVWGTGTKNFGSPSESLCPMFPQLCDAFISVVNVTSLESGQKVLVSSPCGSNGPNCLAHDGFYVTAGSHVTSGSSIMVPMTGTSMATPQVAGAVALLFEAFPDNTPEQITKRILFTADNSWFDKNLCYEDTDQDGVFESTDSFTNSCGGFTNTTTYKGLTHQWNRLYGMGNPDLYEALQPQGYFTLNKGNSLAVLAGAGLFLSTYWDQDFLKGNTAMFRDQLNGGFEFDMGDLVSTKETSEVSKSISRQKHSEWIDISPSNNVNLSFSYGEDYNHNHLNDDHGFYASINTDNYSMYGTQFYSMDQILGLRNNKNAFSILSSMNNQSYLSFTDVASNGHAIGSIFNVNKKTSLNLTGYSGTHSDYNLDEKGMLASINHKFDDFNDITFFLGKNIEDEGILRARGGSIFGDLSANSTHAGFAFNSYLKDRLFLVGLFNYGIVNPNIENNFLLSNIKDITTSQFNLGLINSNIFNSNDFLILNLSQPLQIETGSTNVHLPGPMNGNGYYTYETRKVSLSPSERLMSIDLAYQNDFSKGSSFKVGSKINFNTNNSLHIKPSSSLYGILHKTF